MCIHNIYIYIYTLIVFDTLTNSNKELCGRLVKNKL